MQVGRAPIRLACMSLMWGQGNLPNERVQAWLNDVVKAGYDGVACFEGELLRFIRLIWRNAAEYLFPVAKEKDVALVIGTPFQQGRLAVPRPEWLVEPPSWMDDDTWGRFQELYRIQQESGLSLAELGLRFLLSDPDIACVIPGAANRAQVEENVRCATAGPLPDGIYNRLVALGKVFPDRYC